MKKFELIAIEFLKRCPFQPRTTFTEESIKELANSIRSYGIIEPLLVRPNSNNTFEIIAGERRWRAAQLAGLAEIPCLIAEYSNQDAAALALIENIQREDLNILDEAEGYLRLINEFHFHQEEIGLLMGKSRSHVANILRLLTLCDYTKKSLRENTISLGHARMLVGLSESEQQQLTSAIQKKDLSVRTIESLVRKMKSQKSKPDSCMNNHLEDELAEYLGTEVKIIDNKDHSGWLQIKFYSIDTLDGLLERIGFRYND